MSPQTKEEEVMRAKPPEHVRSQIQGLHFAGHSISQIDTIVNCVRKTTGKLINVLPGQVSDAKQSGHSTIMEPNAKQKCVVNSKIKPTLGLGAFLEP